MHMRHIAGSWCYKDNTTTDCQNGGNCVDDDPYKSYKCECPEGFAGDHCETEAGEHSHCLYRVLQKSILVQIFWRFLSNGSLFQFFCRFISASETHLVLSVAFKNVEFSEIDKHCSVATRQ